MDTGKKYIIKWDKGNAGAYVKIQLLKSGKAYKTIRAKTKNDGRYRWKIPASIRTGSAYKIKITSKTDSTVADSSDKVFTITKATGATGTVTIHEGTLDVTSPDGGESWTVGENQTISWSTTDADIRRFNVTIELYKSGSLIGEITDTSGDNSTDWAGGNGSYTWTIPSSIDGTNLSGSDYTVKITSTGSADYVDFRDVNDQSDANFTISAN